MTPPAAGLRAGGGLAAVVAAGVLWGTGGLVVTVLNDDYALGAMTVSAWRMVIGAAALIAFVILTGRRTAVGAVLRRHPVLALLVGVGTAAYQALYFVAVLAVGVTVATVISLGLAPVLAALWEHTRGGTHPSRPELIVLASALAGLVLMTVFAGEDAGGSGEVALGIALSIAAGATYAATTLLGHRVAGAGDPIALTACATTAGAVVLAPFLLVAAAGSGPVIDDAPRALLLLGYLGVATMALSYALLYAGLRTTSGSAATVATLVEPLSAAVLAAALLGEQVSLPAAVGGVLILAAVLGLALTGRRPDQQVIST